MSLPPIANRNRPSAQASISDSESPSPSQSQLYDDEQPSSRPVAPAASNLNSMAKPRAPVPQMAPAPLPRAKPVSTGNSAPVPALSSSSASLTNPPSAAPKYISSTTPHPGSLNEESSSSASVGSSVSEMQKTKREGEPLKRSPVSKTEPGAPKKLTKPASQSTAAYEHEPALAPASSSNTVASGEREEKKRDMDVRIEIVRKKAAPATAVSGPGPVASASVSTGPKIQSAISPAKDGDDDEDLEEKDTDPDNIVELDEVEPEIPMTPLERFNDKRHSLNASHMAMAITHLFLLILTSVTAGRIDPIPKFILSVMVFNWVFFVVGELLWIIASLILGFSKPWTEEIASLPLTDTAMINKCWSIKISSQWARWTAILTSNINLFAMTLTIGIISAVFRPPGGTDCATIPSDTFPQMTTEGQALWILFVLSYVANALCAILTFFHANRVSKSLKMTEFQQKRAFE